MRQSEGPWQGCLRSGDPPNKAGQQAATLQWKGCNTVRRSDQASCTSTAGTPLCDSLFAAAVSAALASQAG